MIVKTIKGAGFQGTLAYNLQENKNGEVLDKSMLTGENVKDLTHEFSVVRDGSSIKQPVHHFSLSFDNADKISSEQMKQIGRDFLEKMGYRPENNQFVMIRHNDTGHQHFHIVANRVGLDRSVVRDSFDKSKAVQIAKGLERKYSLEIAQSKTAKMQFSKSMTKNQERSTIARSISISLDKGNPNLYKLKEDLKKQGIETFVARTTEGKINGLSFKIEGSKLKHKGSQVGAEYKWNNLSKTLSSNALNVAQKLSPNLVKQGLNVVKGIGRGISQSGGL